MAEPAKLVSAISDAVPAIPGLVWAFRLHSDGSAEPLPIDQPIEFSHDGRLWLHFNLTDARRGRGSRHQRCRRSRASCCCRTTRSSSFTSSTIASTACSPTLVRDIDSADGRDRVPAFRHDRTSPGQRPPSGAVLGRCDAPRARGRLPRRQCRPSPGKDRRRGRRHPGPDGGQARPRDRRHRGTDPRRRRQAWRCAAISAGCAGPASGCIASSPACACCSTGSTRRTPIICAGLAHSGRQAGAAARIGLDHDIVELRERSRLLERSCASRTRRRATSTSTRSRS